MSQAVAAPDWGHPILTPEGKEIRVPKRAYEELRVLGLLQNNRARLSPLIYELLDPENAPLLAQRLRLLLGPDLDGPRWLVCNCRECREKRGELDEDEDLFEKTFVDVDQVVRNVTARRRRNRR